MNPRIFTWQIIARHPKYAPKGDVIDEVKDRAEADNLLIAYSREYLGDDPNWRVIKFRKIRPNTWHQPRQQQIEWLQAI